jgi:type IV pilus assembly protein PilO
MAFPPKSQRDQAMLLVGIIAIGLVGAYWNFVYKPKADELTIQQERVDTLEVRNARAKVEMASGSIDKLKAEADAFARDLEVMRQLVPTSNEVPALLEQVSTAARRVGLDLATVQPEPVIEGDQFDTYTYKISVTGGYHAIARFLSNVGSLTRIVAPMNLTLAAATNPKATAVQRRAEGASALDTKLEIQTYVVRTATVTRGGKF